MTSIRRHPGRGGGEDSKSGKLLNFPKRKQALLPQTGEETKTILVGDDEPHMVRLLRLNLEPEGYQVLDALDGETAYKLAVEKLPDIVLLDIVFPVQSGIDVCKALKKNSKTSHIPVILITARGEGMRKASLDSGADLFLAKPFSPLRLLAEIRRMAGKKSGASS